MVLSSTLSTELLQGQQPAGPEAEGDATRDGESGRRILSLQDADEIAEPEIELDG